MIEKDKVIIAKLVLKITLIMIIVSAFIKLLGFNLFEANYQNSILNFIEPIFSNSNVKGIFNGILLFLQTFVIFRIHCKKINFNSLLIIVIFITLFTIFSQILIYDLYYTSENYNLYNTIYNLFSFSILIIPVFIINFIKLKNYKKTLLSLVALMGFLFVIFLYQLIVIFLRSIITTDFYDSIYNFLLNFDYMILLLLTFYIYIKSEYKIISKNKLEFSFLKFLNERPNKNDIKYKLDSLSKNYKDFKKQTRATKIAFILYIIFFAIQECLTLGLLIFIANLNNYLIECVFIMTAFMISKKVFGAFHFKSFILCFFISNITFFILSSLTLEVNLTFVVPVLCGVLLSYFASKFIKKNDVTPYRGMSEDDLKPICKNKKLNELETNVLIDFYCKRDNVEKIAFKYHYSDRSIQRIKFKALQKVEA